MASNNRRDRPTRKSGGAPVDELSEVLLYALGKKKHGNYGVQILLDESALGVINSGSDATKPPYIYRKLDVVYKHAGQYSMNKRLDSLKNNATRFHRRESSSLDEALSAIEKNEIIQFGGSSSFFLNSGVNQSLRTQNVEPKCESVVDFQRGPCSTALEKSQSIRRGHQFSGSVKKLNRRITESSSFSSQYCGWPRPED